MGNILVVGVGGFIGAVARYGLSGLAKRCSTTSFPVGTLVVNVLGCLAIGSLMWYIESREGLSPNIRLFVMVGLLGSLTTFSAFGCETIELMRAGDMRLAMISVLANVMLGLAAVVVGRSLPGLVVSA